LRKGAESSEHCRMNQSHLESPEPPASMLSQGSTSEGTTQQRKMQGLRSRRDSAAQIRRRILNFRGSRVNLIFKGCRGHTCIASLWARRLFVESWDKFDDTGRSASRLFFFPDSSSLHSSEQTVRFRCVASTCGCITQRNDCATWCNIYAVSVLLQSSNFLLQFALHRIKQQQLLTLQAMESEKLHQVNET